MKNKNVIEELEFNSAQYAKDVLNENVNLLEKTKKSLIFGGVAILSLVLAFPIARCNIDIVSNLGGLLGIAYIVCNILCIFLLGKTGIKNFFSMLFRISKIGWHLVPFFLIDICVAIAIFGYTFIVGLFCPVVYVLVFRKQLKKNIAKAEEYLSYCQPASNSEEV